MNLNLVRNTLRIFTKEQLVQWVNRPVLLCVADHEEDDEVGPQGRNECVFCVGDSGA